jgi:hypothetical protein
MQSMIKAFGIGAALFAAGTAFGQAINEHFDDINTLTAAGWAQQNNSAPIGPQPWFQGNLTVFGPQATAGYIAVNWASATTSGVGDISNWLFMPARTLRNGDVLKFWTRTVDSPFYPDRLSIRMSLNGSSTNVGTTPFSLGDFTTELLTINPNLTVVGYPSIWTQYTLTLSGIPSPTLGRIAFHYNVPNGGGLGANSDFIGVDEVVYTPASGCYPDCNGDGILGLADFGCFQTKFALNDPYADCNGDGILGLADFGCFQTKFALGCP